jgi:hypothetical protein
LEKKSFGYGLIAKANRILPLLLVGQLAKAPIQLEVPLDVFLDVGQRGKRNKQAEKADDEQFP